MEEEDDRKKPFHTCKFCWYRSKSTFVMCKHVHLHRTKTKTDTFTCDSKAPELLECEYCEFETNLKVDLAEHFRIFHEAREVNGELENILRFHRCDWCDFKTHSVVVLAKHDDDCRFKTLKNVKLKRHTHYVRRHIIAKDTNLEHIDWFKCERCDRKYKRKNYLNSHVRKKHTNPGDVNCWPKREKYPYKCTQCDYKSKYKGDLKRHITAKHMNPDAINWFECAHCDHKFKRKHHLNRHVIVKHTNLDDLKWFKCEKCPFKSVYNNGLKGHIRNKHPEDPRWLNKCLQCGYKFKRKYHLKRHVAAKHAKLR